MRNILIVGSGFLASLVLTRCAGFNDTCITVMDRKDPMTIVNYNNDTKKIFEKYCSGMTYRDMMNPHSTKQWGDPKRNMEIKLRFIDYVNQPGWQEFVDKPDIVFNCGSIYDRLYADINPDATFDFNVNAVISLIQGLHTYEDKKPLLVHFSSINVYGDLSDLQGQKTVIDESTQPVPKDPLHRSLYLQEEHVQKSKLDYAIMRLGTLVGDFTPQQSLINQALLAVLRGDDEFQLDHSSEESIELFDMADLGAIINAIILKCDDTLQYKIFKNQIYNVKVEEPEPKTIGGVVNAIYQCIGRLPKINGIKLSAPEIKKPFNKPNLINFAQIPISSFKFNNTFAYAASNPMIFSILHATVNYLLNYVIVGMDEGEKNTFKKIFAIDFTPTEESAKKEGVNQDVVDTVKDVNDSLEKI